jgi:hypothetical protein
MIISVPMAPIVGSAADFWPIFANAVTVVYLGLYLSGSGVHQQFIPRTPRLCWSEGFSGLRAATTKPKMRTFIESLRQSSHER